MESDHKKSRRRRWIIVLILLAVAIGTVEWLASRLIRAKLVELVEAKLDAKLKVGTLIYLPPMGVWARDVALQRGDGELMTVAGLTLKLAELPWSGKPIVIESLSVDQPELKLEPDKFTEVVKSGTGGPANPSAPKKLSEMLRLRRLKLFGGRITYRDPAKSQAPMVWENLSANVNLEQQSASRYRFQVTSQAEPLVDASATGQIDVDTLELELRNVLVKARVEPEPTSSPFPAELQVFLAKHKVTGSAAATGDGNIPLKSPRQSSFDLAIALQDATALLPAQGTMVDHARANIGVVQSPGGPVVVTINKIDLVGDREELIVNAGTLELNAASGVWKLAGVQGQVNFRSDLTTAPTQPAENAVDRARPSGRLDFTVAASGPFDLAGKRAWDAINHEVLIYPRGLSFQLKGLARRVEEVDEGELRLVDGVLVLQEVGARYADDFFRIRSARLPLEDLPDVVRWREISAVVTFNPPIRRYNATLDKLFERLNPSGPFVIAGSYTYDKSGPQPISAYDLIISSDTGALTLTDRRIPLERIRGDATVTPTEIDIHSLEAQLLGGTFQGSAHLSLGDDLTTFQGELIAREVDLAKLEERLKDEQVIKPLQGKLFAEASLSGELDNLSALRANGQVEAIDGSLFRLQVVSHVAERVKGVKEAVTVGDAAAIFAIEADVLRLRDVAINSPLLGIHGGGTIDMKDGALNLQLVAAPLADWRDKVKTTGIPLISDVAGEIIGNVQKLLNTATGNLLYAFRVEGKIGEVKVSTIPAPALTETVAYIFGHMAQPRKDERLIDVIRHEHPVKKPGTQPARK